MNPIESQHKHLEQLSRGIAMVKRTQEHLPVLPALVSWVRIVLLPFCLWAGWNEHYIIMFWLCLVAASSDYFDGWLARKLKRSSTPGKTLDILADKLFLSVMLIFLARLGIPNGLLAMIPAWYHITVVLGLLVVSWSIKIPVVAITTSERLTIILSYVLVLTAAGTFAYEDKTIFNKLLWVAQILTPISVIFGVVSYFRFSRRLIQRYMQ
ncbi:MAG: CDP-alcohol phosphatidyltransferase family protein [Candidatus Sabulitectum sp.]|nr:CDP-alcohol phosphatidyltransferase family protein [Candidatus Sabulitectum sp.]